MITIRTNLITYRKLTFYPLSFLVVLFMLSISCAAQNQKMETLIDNEFVSAAKQYKLLNQNIPAGLTPQSYNTKTDKVIAYDIKWWCSGFYAGSLWYIYEQTKDKEIEKDAQTALKLLVPNQNYTGNHDLGFMMFCSFGNAYRLTKNEDYKKIIFKSAASLSTRYRPEISSIQSWDKNKYFNCPVIIDNLMNLEMLNWVSANGGDNRFKDIAVKHANTSLKNHFRSDFSSYHVVDYDLNKGEVLRKATWQGAANTSAWARGQGWALYGYTMMYRFTKDQKYLDQANGIANFILKHPNLPADKIPYWDFDAPLIPYAKRDASAGALIASALLELGQYSSVSQRKEYVAAAETMIKSLSSPAYKAKAGQNGGFLLLHSTGAYPLNSEIDVPLIYADYYYLEALSRYKAWYL